MKIKKITLPGQVFIAMILGVIFGLIFGKTMNSLGFIGTIWLNSIKMIIIPMILATIVVGIASQKDLKSFGRVGSRILIYYIITTILAAIIGLVSASIIKPGLISNLTGLSANEVSGTVDITISEFVLGLFSKNIFETFTNGNIIQTLIISILIGISILLIKNSDIKQRLISGFESFEALVNSLIGIIMKVSPIGIFFLMADSFGKYGVSIFKSMGALLGTFYFGILLQIVFVYCLVLFIGAKINPFTFVKNSVQLIMYTVSTCSSVAAIPVNIKVAKEKFKVPESISGFTIPLGSQLNSDGSVVLYGCVILFISQMNGLNLTIGVIFQMIFLSTLFSLGGSGIPGSNIVKIFVLVQAFGLPVEVVGIVAAFYRLFDMGTTTGNCMGDLAGTIFVHRLEEKRKMKKEKSTIEVN